MKKIYSLFVLCTFGILCLTSADDNSEGKAGFTGAPGEQTCNTSGCHTGTMLNMGGGDIEITSPDLVNWEYVPGESYTISVTVSQANRSLFGFCFEALQPSGDNAGFLTAGAGSQILTKLVGGISRRSVTHVENGGATPNAHTFTFTWDAPETNIGNITFYTAGNATNGNGFASGDLIYSTSQVVTPQVISGISELKPKAEIQVFPNPFVSNVRINYHLTKQGLVKAQIFDLSGREIKSMVNTSQWPGDYSIDADLSELASGQYIMHLSVNGEVLTTELLQK